MTPHTGAPRRVRRPAALLACALSLTMLLGLASTAEAQTASGGAEAQSAPASDATLRVSYGRRHLLVGSRARVSGTLSSGERGRTVSIQRRIRGGWRTVARARTGEAGRFVALYRLRTLGAHRLRARAAGVSPTAAAAGTGAATVTAYRAGHASWYGPGLYGNRLGCGGRLSTRTLGVAHKSLPCGTKVTFRYRGRAVTVPVVDRGPYIAGRTWDLTARTKRALGFPSTGVVWSNR